METGEKCLVIGSGVSGIGSTHLLEQMGADVTLYDSDDKLSEEMIREKLQGPCCGGNAAGRNPVRRDNGGVEPRRAD